MAFIVPITGEISGGVDQPEHNHRRDRSQRMIVLNAVTPGPEQAADFFGGEEGPFVMLNLLKFKPHAEYPDGSDAHLTGFEAYMRYGMAVRAHIERVGGTPGYAGRVTGLMLGTVGELWDMVALAQYPSLAAMRAMVEDPGYQAISVHRTAGLAGQLNIKTQGASL
jgi:uncharacterized protein (DUF1330 family)